MDDMDLTPKEEAILTMEGLGFKLIRLRGKLPQSMSWQNLTKSEIDLNHSGNYGVALNEETVVIDVDPKNGGTPSYKKLLKDLGLKGTMAFNTLSVRTGKDGLHVYLRKPEDMAIRWTMAKEYPGLEFRTKGQQMVGPYSLHPETKKEYLFRDDNRQIADAPQNLLDLIKKVEAVPTTALASASDSAGTISRYVKYLQEEAPANEGEGGDNFTYLVACKGKDFGLSMDVTYELMQEWWNQTCSPPWSAEDLYVKVQNAYTYGDQPLGHMNPESQFSPIDGGDDDAEGSDGTIKVRWDTNKDKTLKSTLNNAVNYFKMPNTGLRGMLRYNTLSREIEFVKPAPWHHSNEGIKKSWSDSDAINGKYLLSAKYSFDVYTQLIHEAAAVSAFATKYNPLTTYLDALEWDGVKRLDTWLTDYAGVQNDIYTRTVGRKTLIAGIARAYRPGIKFDHVLVLEGEQGVGKSTLCQILGGRWYADVILDPNNKDAVSTINGKWVVELSEMYTTRKAESDALKAFISRCEDRVRPAYARSTEDFPRTCIFMGTINPDENTGYLKDQTGNRRFWPVRMEQLKLSKFKKDCDQLWAEAKVAFEAGEEIHIIDPDTNRLALAEANKRKVSDPWVHAVENFLDNHKDIDGNVPEIVYVEDIWVDVISGDIRSFGVKEKARVSSIMKDLGYEGKTRYDKTTHKSRYGYMLKKVKPNRGEWDENE